MLLVYKQSAQRCNNPPGQQQIHQHQRIYPSIFRRHTQHPCMIGHTYLITQTSFLINLLCSGNRHILSGLRNNMKPVIITLGFQFLQHQRIQSLRQIQDDYGKSPETLFSIFIGQKNRIPRYKPQSALCQTVRAGQRNFPCVHSQQSIITTTWIIKNIITNNCLISL